MRADCNCLTCVAPSTQGLEVVRNPQGNFSRNVLRLALVSGISEMRPLIKYRSDAPKSQTYVSN